MPSIRWTLLPLLFALGCGGGGSSPPPQTPVAPDTLVGPICTAQHPGVFGARAFSNKTKADIDLAGTDDLVMTAMQESGCFTVAERDKVDLLIEEMSRCNDDNPDKQYYACDGFAKKGQLYGVTDFVFGDVVLFEPKIKGVELAVKLPGVGGIDVGRTYSALAINVRVVDVATGKVLASKIVSAVLPDDQGGFGVSGGTFALKAAAYDRHPAGQALQGMIAGAIKYFSSSLGS